jgi:hypothetical protein
MFDRMEGIEDFQDNRPAPWDFEKCFEEFD